MIINLYGDIFPANLHYNIGFGVVSKFKNLSENFVIDQLKKFTSLADLNIGNLEAPLLPENYIPENNSFMGCSSFSRIMRHSGFDCLNLANNHIYEYGEIGLRSTISLLENENINYFGINDEYGNNNISIIEKKNFKIGIAGFNDIDNYRLSGEISAFDKTRFLKALQFMDEQGVQIKIFSLHWGTEYMKYPSVSQVELGKYLIDSGVTIIHGHHPHVVQPIQKYNDGVIIYSLGNFIFDLFWEPETRFGFVFQIEFKNISQKTYKIIPYYINDDYLPQKLSDNCENIEKYLFNEKIHLLDNYDAIAKNILRKNKYKMRLYLLKNIKKIGLIGISEIIKRKMRRTLK